MEVCGSQVEQRETFQSRLKSFKVSERKMLMLNYGSALKIAHLEALPEIFKYSVQWLLLMIWIFFSCLTRFRFGPTLSPGNYSVPCLHFASECRCIAAWSILMYTISHMHLNTVPPPHAQRLCTVLLRACVLQPASWEAKCKLHHRPRQCCVRSKKGRLLVSSLSCCSAVRSTCFSSSCGKSCVSLWCECAGWIFTLCSTFNELKARLREGHRYVSIHDLCLCWWDVGSWSFNPTCLK